MSLLSASCHCCLEIVDALYRPPLQAKLCQLARQAAARVQGCSCNSVFVQYVAANRGYTAKTLAVGEQLCVPLP